VSSLVKYVCVRIGVFILGILPKNSAMQGIHVSSTKPSCKCAQCGNMKKNYNNMPNSNENYIDWCVHMLNHVWIFAKRIGSTTIK